MNNLKNIIFVLSFIFTIVSCTEDEQVNTDCFTCDTTQAEYCYTIGNSYFTLIQNDITKQKTLNGSWSATKELLAYMCENGSFETDCYTCELTNTTYCYTIGNNYYTSVFNDNQEQINLEDNSWISQKIVLQENCKANLVGTWTMSEYKATTERTITGQENPTISEKTGSDFDYTLIFNETPSQYSKSGSYNFTITTTDGETGEVTEDVGVTSVFLEEGNWMENNENITYEKIVNEEVVETTTSKIIEHTYNTLTEEYTKDTSYIENGITHSTHTVTTTSYQRKLD